MNKTQETKEKICAFYASDYHFEMISLPYINKQIEEDKQVIILTENNFRIVSIDDSYSEIFAEQPHLSVQAKIIEQNPKETSIDFYISAEYLFGNRKKVNSFLTMVYANLEKAFELKGLGLHK